MVALNENAVVVGYPPFTSRNGIAWGEVCTISNEERDKACRKGLSAAVARKSMHDGGDCTLAVFAQEFYEQLLDAILFERLVDAVLAEHRLGFDSVCVFDNQPGFFVERRQ